MAKIRVRARAVDMLGRQQIAGIPTAIHELFKNAHDAYAEHVEVDLFRDDKLLIIRDDGYGMTRQDFEGRWLTLGTESKIGSDQPDRNVAFKDRSTPAPRPIMGEKGIGRLAIAAIGPQVLVMTRATRHDGLAPLVASLIHWGLFEIPGIDLDQIQIPIEEVPAGKLPNRTLLQRLVAQVQANIASLEGIPAVWRDRLLADLALMDVEPQDIDARVAGLTLCDKGYGTHFYIRPINPVLIDDIEGGTTESASPLERMLLGFSNTMLPGRPVPGIVGEFRDHRHDGTVHELIGERAFFSAQEFSAADHHIEGSFDGYGQFQGTVSVYRGEPKPYSLTWPGAVGRLTDCGPFKIKFAYVQGEWKDSRLPQDEWVLLIQKLDRIGGLYVYRDGIRILPYGNSDYDFLNIEKRRTKSASDWFFSYRRVFGAVELTGAGNPELVEKAGREGFRENLAYRQFVVILENFFKRLALDFFRPTSQFGEDFVEYREQLNRERELLKKRERSTRVRRREFTLKLNGFFSNLERGGPGADAVSIREMVEKRLERILEIRDPDAMASALIELEGQARERIRALEEVAAKPCGLAGDGFALEIERSHEPASPVESGLSGPCGASYHSVDLLRKRLEDLSADLLGVFQVGVPIRLERLAEANGAGLRDGITDLEAIFTDVKRTDLDELPDADSRNLQRNWERRIDNVARETRDLLESLRDQLASVAKAVREREPLEETTAAIESAAEQYRDELELYIELAQIGMALGIVQHEFGVAVRNIRSAIRKLKPWADGTPDLRTLYHCCPN